jgi:hypothetical protein
MDAIIRPCSSLASDNENTQITYQDLFDSGLPLVTFAKACKVSKITHWVRDGVPAKYQKTLLKVFNNHQISTHLKQPSSLTASTSPADSEARSFLGNYAESSPPNKINDLQAVKSKPLKSSKWGFDEQIAERYALQFQARKSILEHWYSLSEDEKEKTKKPHRVCNCRRNLRPVFSENRDGKKIYSMSTPAIYQHKETSNTFYGGLLVCGSLYACPVCAPKIAEIRAAEIRNVVTQWVKDGGICLFITLTFPHYASDSMKSSITALKAALTRFRKGKAYDAIVANLGYTGLIRAIETTWGEANGSHPHVHEIWFVRPVAGFIPELVEGKQFKTNTLTGFFDEYLKPDLFKKWESAVVASGMRAPSYERGMVIKVAETEEQLLIRIAEYLAKTGIEKPAWGVDDELTKLHSKRGMPDRFTPFDFLRQQYNVELTKGEKYRFRCLFAEYVDAFKGTSKIFWSKGLKAKFAIDDVTDEQIAEEQTENSSLVFEIPPPIWVFVIGINDHRAQLLLKVKNEGVQAAKEWLKSLLDLYYEYIEDPELLSPDLQHILEYYAPSYC